MAGIVEDVKTAKVEIEAKNQAAGNTSAPYKPEGSSDNTISNKYLNTANEDFRLCIGCILDTLPLNHTYRVGTSLLGTPIVCQALQSSLYGKSIAASCTGYSVGSYVLVAFNTVYNTGVILGGFDIPTGVENYCFRSIISGLTRRYGDEDVTNKSIFLNRVENTGNGSYHAGNMSFDEHGDVPEWGFSSITGTKMFVDPYMILIGTDEYTALSMFYRDSLLRLSAINYQFRSSGREEEYFNDEGEYIEYRGTAIMPYEHFGFFNTSGDKIKKNDRDDWYKEGSITPPYEVIPNDYKLAPFHRVMEFGGWLGQGTFTQVITPPKDKEYMKYDDTKFKCVSRTQSNIDGRISVATTRGISITKDGIIPAATRKNRPDEISNSEGDNKDNYKHTDLEIPREIRTDSGATHACMQKVLGILDYSGYNKNWAEIFQFAYHTGDYVTPEESDFEEKSICAPSYSDLKSNYLLKEDETYKVKVDDKREIEYTQNEAGIHLLPDGGIVIYDGSGSEIRFVKGQITISCAGDINIKPGRNINLWAGNDIIEKARGTIEISSSEKSVRIKAEETLALLGANNGSSTDGVIIESKSKSNVYDFGKLGDDIITNGIVLKSKNSPVSTIGDLVYIRSGTEAGGKGIVFDASKGESDIYVNAKSFTEFVQQDHIVNFFSGEPEEVEGTTRFSLNDTYLMGRLVVTGDLTMDGTILMSKDFVSCGTIMSYGNQSGMISPFGEDTKAKYISVIDKNTEVPEEKYPETESKLYTKSIATLLYNDKRIGNDTTLKGLGFSFRTDEQLKLPDDYYVYEDLWQHISANSDKPVTDKWEEKQVECYAGITYPFPGKKAYTEPKYITQETVFADFKKGKYLDRKVSNNATQPGEDKYFDPAYGKQNKKSLNEYTIIKK